MFRLALTVLSEFLLNLIHSTNMLQFVLGDPDLVIIIIVKSILTFLWTPRSQASTIQLSFLLAKKWNYNMSGRRLVFW